MAQPPQPPVPRGAAAPAPTAAAGAVAQAGDAAPAASGSAPGPGDAALEAALLAVLEPLAGLAVARGLPYAALDDLLKRSLVKAAATALAPAPPQRSVSRISTATGINRREVTRLTQAADETLVQGGQPPPARPQAQGATHQLHEPRRPQARSLASEVFTRWLGTPAWRDEEGLPLVLARLGPAPSFEALAQDVTRDVHPRSLLDELLRLDLAVLDEVNDRVALRREGFVPSGDRARMLAFMADNVGDHLQSAVANVLGGGRRHFEQALYADGLSAASVEKLRALIGSQWQALLASLVPPLEAWVKADEAAGDATHRVRIGLFAFDDAPAPPEAARSRRHTPDAHATPRRRVRKVAKDLP